VAIEERELKDDDRVRRVLIGCERSAAGSRAVETVGAGLKGKANGTAEGDADGDSIVMSSGQIGDSTRPIGDPTPLKDISSSDLLLGLSPSISKSATCSTS
jgi:hypothetical protein